MLKYIIRNHIWNEHLFILGSALWVKMDGWMDGWTEHYCAFLQIRKYSLILYWESIQSFYLPSIMSAYLWDVVLVNTTSPIKCQSQQRHEAHQANSMEPSIVRDTLTLAVSVAHEMMTSWKRPTETLPTHPLLIQKYLLSSFN